MSQREQSKAQLLGIDVDAYDLNGTVAEVERLMASDGLAHVVTANLDYLAQMQRDVRLAEVVRRADLVVADGVPLLWMAAWSRQHLPGRVNGTDLVVRLLSVASERGWKVALLGGDPGVAEAAAKAAHARWGTPVSGVWPLTPAEVGDPAISSRVASEVGDLGRPLVLVALGAGRQDKWISDHGSLLGGGVAIGVGSALDFIAGTRPRAPRALQRTGFEWLWRMFQEPRRLWRRYLVEDLGLLCRFGLRALVLRMRRG